MRSAAKSGRRPEALAATSIRFAPGSSGTSALKRPPSTAASTEWAAALQQIFDEPWRVRPAFQPILHLERRAVWGFQVLARFISPLRATPPEWLAAAADAGVRRALEVR